MLTVWTLLYMPSFCTVRGSSFSAALTNLLHWLKLPHSVWSDMIFICIPVVTDIGHLLMSSMLTSFLLPLLPPFFLLMSCKCSFKTKSPRLASKSHVAEAGLEFLIFLPSTPKFGDYRSEPPHPAVCVLCTFYICIIYQINLTNIFFILWAIFHSLDILKPQHCSVYRMHKAVCFYIDSHGFSIRSLVSICLGNVSISFMLLNN